jgi:hypothetical protein
MAVIMFRNGRSEELGPAAQAPKTLADHWGGASGWREFISKRQPVQVLPLFLDRCFVLRIPLVSNTIASGDR